MTWNTPKEDWATNTGIGFTDLNKIGGNLTFLRDRFTISGRPTDLQVTAGVTANTTAILQRISITIPANKQLILYSTTKYLNDGASNVLVLSVAATNTCVGTLEQGEEFPEFMLAYNVTASPVIEVVSIGVKNTHLILGSAFSALASWMIRMYLADV